MTDAERIAELEEQIDTRRALGQLKAENDELRRQLALVSQTRMQAKVERLEKELVDARAEADLFRGCCSRAFGIWATRHPERAGEDGAKAIAALLAEVES
jgi:hypothetical protein